MTVQTRTADVLTGTADVLTGTGAVTDTDVAVVGYGPVGQLLAILLARCGWRVTVVERWAQPYPMPRAVGFDDEAARILAAVGIGPFLDKFGENSRDYAWRNAAGDTLLHMESVADGHCGWPQATAMYQPGLEATLIERGAEFPNLRVVRGQEVVELDDRGDLVEVISEDADEREHAFTARYVVGCDGANSFVRESMDSPLTDLGFFYDWLICDVVLDEPRDFRPNNLQICDPLRPRTAVSAGPGHRRFEFMRLPGENIEELKREDTLWRMLEMFSVRPDNATLERHAVYTFQARWVGEWRKGRLLIAGDAAHLMPPFAGQGMCSGFRDVANLSWKLDLALRGLADESVLDTYTSERRAHVRNAITTSVRLGKVICVTDAAAAADRDAIMLAARERDGAAALPMSTAVPLDEGLFRQTDDGTPARPAGTLFPQARVADAEGEGLFDEIVGLGFVLLTADDPAALLDDRRRTFLDGLGTRVAHVLPGGAEPETPGPGAVVDIEGRYLPYLAEYGATAVLVRPDFTVFGAADGPGELGALVDELARRLGTPVPAAD
ncbi:bifunctional 3-(3-hydroxy-phenyl)propionate/3-hydroxycinnamic acid hydroxylase [Streptomyces scabiei]|uniref:bifunctional 3-(3-hydroxy-phenyl)propionate/3-hydroxycinnamic acid hydroxylase MhpA n=1 Tax=Streptomyces scabiei TaxID=1930 RepID=UPI0029B69633|nr:bifunctional 3-(3-hydroxy-phenyl)propionate/3-hydroxycinnamic acid hydroxylase [Streptomyces scabiei]MDX3118542.1 bifunctional 3-(3-hydroxy-phenyl)propionate/3-hydroxycinnamic acid hydroxylase [Streptomyces scabiei]